MSNPKQTWTLTKSGIPCDKCGINMYKDIQRRWTTIVWYHFVGNKLTDHICTRCTNLLIEYTNLINANCHSIEIDYP